jgi:hypothetical protein
MINLSLKGFQGSSAAVSTLDEYFLTFVLFSLTYGLPESKTCQLKIKSIAALTFTYTSQAL